MTFPPVTHTKPDENFTGVHARMDAERAAMLTDGLGRLHAAIINRHEGVGPVALVLPRPSTAICG